MHVIMETGNNLAHIRTSHHTNRLVFGQPCRSSMNFCAVCCKRAVTERAEEEEEEALVI